LRQRFEPGEMAPPLLALPATQTQTIIKDTHSVAPAAYAGSILAGPRCLGGAANAGDYPGYRNDAKIRLNYGCEPGVPNVRRER
jgi:hypothetical protein